MSLPGKATNKVGEIRKIFKLTDPFWSQMPDDLLLLAFSRTPVKGKYTTLMKKYGTVTHQSLEFYGDKVMTLLVNGITLEDFDFDNVPYHNIYTSLTTNKFITNMMVSMGVCKTLSLSYWGKHNACGDSFEALLGALYWWGYKQEGSCILERIMGWYNSLDGIQKQRASNSHRWGKVKELPQDMSLAGVLVEGKPIEEEYYKGSPVILYFHKGESYEGLVNYLFHLQNWGTPHFELIQDDTSQSLIVVIPGKIKTETGSRLGDFMGISINRDREEASRDLLENLIAFGYIEVIIFPEALPLS